MLKELTNKYIAAFDNKDIESISNMIKDDFILEDPVVKRIQGKDAVLETIQGIFNSCDKLDFKAKNIFCDDNTTIIEFILDLDGTVLEGIDIIEWDGNIMKELRAYLDIPCNEDSK